MKNGRKMSSLLYRMLAWILVVSFLSGNTGDLLPDVVQALIRAVHTANAEKASLPEAFSLDEQPLGEEQTSGDWRYALREGDGYAVITGYDGGSVSSLKVPQNLDGVDVVGIAEGALDVAGLWHVTLNGSVMYIAEGAFGAANPTIHALNGSYALYWADQHGMEYENETEGTLVPGVIDYTDAPEGSVTRRGDSHVVFTPLAALRLEVGSIFWFVDGRGLQYFYRVTALTKEGRRVVASVEQPELSEAVVEMHYEGTIVVGPEDFIPAEGVTLRDTSSTYEMRDESTKKTISLGKLTIFPYNTRKKNDIPNTLLSQEDQLKHEFNIEADIYINVRYRYDIVDGEIVSAESMRETISTYTCSFKGGRQLTGQFWNSKKDQNTETLVWGKETLQNFKDLLNRDCKFNAVIPWGKINVNAGIISLGVDLRVKAEYAGIIEGVARSVEIEHSIYDGTEKNEKDRWKILEHEKEWFCDEWNLIGEGKVCIESRITLKFVGLISFLQLSLEGGGKAKLAIPMSAIISETDVPQCVEALITPYAKASIYVGLWVEGKNKNGQEWISGAKGEVIKGELDLADLMTLHFSLEGIHLKQNCPYTDIVTVSFVTRTAEKMEDYSVLRNKPIPYDEKFILPDDAQYGQFLGWADNPNTNFPNWVLGDDGNIVTQGMTLYAVWENSASITFDSCGGTAIPAQSAPAGSLVIRPEDPMKSGTYFCYWYALDDAGNEIYWNFATDTVPEGGITLYACWADEPLTVSGGTQGVTYIGDKSVLNDNYGPLVTGEEYLTYSFYTHPTTEETMIIITGTKNNPTNLLIPARMSITDADGNKKNYPVWAISDTAFKNNKTLQKVTLGAMPYYYVDNGLLGGEVLFSEYIITSLQFSGCTSLVCVDFTDSKMPAVPASMFSGCTALKCVKLPTGVKMINNNAFEYCSSLTNIRIPEGISTIGAHAFRGCTGMTELYLPDSLGTLSVHNSTYKSNYTYYVRWYEGPFTGCTGLRKISVGGLSTISYGMLRTGSQKLEELVIRGTVGKIGEYAFDSARTYDDSVYVDDVAKNKNGYDYATTSARLVIEEGVTSIGANAFRNCDMFTEIILPDSITTIGGAAFYDCDRVKVIDLPESLTAINGTTFESCAVLESVGEVPGTVSSIGDYAFKNCTNLKNISFSEGLTGIGTHAFYNCTSLTELYLPDSLKTLSVHNSTYKSNYTYYVRWYEGPFTGCTGLRKISVGGLSTLSYGMLRTGSQKLEELVIRGTVGKIGEHAFNSELTYGDTGDGDAAKKKNGYDITATSARLIIEDGVTSIGTNAFYNCDIFTEVVLPNSLTSIGSGAFKNSNRIKALKIGSWNKPGSVSALTSIADDAFSGCSSMRVYVDSENTYVENYFASKGFMPSDEIVKVYITYSANGGMFVDAGSEITIESSWQNAMPDAEIPTNGDRLFCGWYTDAACTKKYMHDTVPAGNLTLYAGWNIDCYTVTLNANGGAFDVDGESVESLSFMAQKGSEPVEDIAANLPGMVFIGWFTDAQCSTKFSGIMPAADITLYAGWMKSSVNADYEFENGEAKLISYSLIEYEGDEVYLPEMVNGMPLTGIGAYAFYGEPVTKLYLPASVKEIEENALSGMDMLKSIQVNPANAVYCDVNGVLMSKDKTELVWYPAQKGVSYQIPAGVTKIGAHAFSESNIRSVVLNEGLTEIGAYAFSGRALSRIDLPDSLMTIGKCAFYCCEGIGSIVAGANLMEIGELAFYGCGNPLLMYGPVEDCAIQRYAQTYSHGYNQYILTLNYPDGTQKNRVAQAGSVLVLPVNPAVPENSEFTGWYTDAECTAVWTESDTMPQCTLVLYSGTKSIFDYETIQISVETESTDATTGETTVITEIRTALRLTEYLSSNVMAVVPESIGGVKVERIAAACFGEYVTDVAIPDCVNLIEEGAFANNSIRIVCSQGSAAYEYAQQNAHASKIPECRISFVVNCGAEIPVMTAEQGELIELPVPVRSGCSAAGWYLDEALTEAVMLDENGLWTVPKQNTVLYAAWTVENEALATPAFTYEQRNNAIIVTGLLEEMTELVIPEMLHGMPVTEIEEHAFRSEKTLVSVQIPGTVHTIPANAFRGCTALESVVLGEGVEEIGANAFYGCTALEELELPDSVTTAGVKAFANSALRELTLGEQFKLITADALNGCDSLETISVADGNMYYESADGVLYDLVDSKLVKYPANRSGKEYTVQTDCCVIGAYAFQGAKKLEYVVLHEDIWELGEYAFYGCSALKQIPETTGSYLVTIPANCFAGCTALTEVEISETIEVIDQNAFAFCSMLGKIIIPENVVYIGSGALPDGVTIQGVYGSAAEEYADENGNLFVDPDATVLPQSVSIAGYEGMMERGQMIQLTAQILPETATLTDVYWYSSDESIARVYSDGTVRAIAGGSAVISVWTKNGLTAEIELKVDPTVKVEVISLNVAEAEIGIDETLQLTASYLPANATHQTAVWTSSDETVATVDENGLVTPVGSGETIITAAAHNGLTSKCVVKVYRIVEQIMFEGVQNGQAFDVGASVQLAVSVVPEDVPDPTVTFASSDASIATVDEQGIVTFASCGYVTITATAADRGTVTASLELECLSEFNFVLPESITVIEEDAFAGIPAQSVIIPDGAEVIYDGAFSNCANLYKIVVPSSVKEIAEHAFDASDRVTICAPEGSYAQSYAAEQGIRFRAVQP